MEVQQVKKLPVEMVISTKQHVICLQSNCPADGKVWGRDIIELLMDILCYLLDMVNLGSNKVHKT